MSPVRSWILAKENRAHFLSYLALIIAAVFAVLTVILHYNETTRLSRQDARQARALAAATAGELHRIQNAFCGVPADPGVFPLLAAAPETAQTSALGHRLVDASKRGVIVLQCPR